MIIIIKKLRNKNNLTQKKLADKVGISQSYISKLERCGYEEYEKVMVICDKLAQVLCVCPFLISVWAMNKKLDYPLSYDLIREFEEENLCNSCNYENCNARKTETSHLEYAEELGVFIYEQNKKRIY